MTYAIISVSGKQYRVQEGERLLVDRVATAEGETFTPRLLMLGGDGDVDLDGDGATVTARVVGHMLGQKIRIGKYRPKNGYRRHTGFRARLSQIEIQTIAKGAARKTKREAQAAKKEAAADVEAATEPAGGLPAGYEDMTIAQLKDAAASWDAGELEAALAYERDHAARKGAIAALESALEEKREG